MSLIRSRSVVWIDTGVAILSAALFFWSIHAANEAAADAVRRYGYNVDSGALVLAVGVIYFAPVALIFGLAALSLWRDWRVQWFMHWFAVACALGPVLLAGATLVVEQMRSNQALQPTGAKNAPAAELGR
jgi:hypothetical protein